MKTRNYEKEMLILICTSLSIIGEIILLFQFHNIKMNQYKNFSMILVDKKTGYVIAKKEERKLLYQNSQLYIKDKKWNYQIIEDQEVYKDKEETYHRILLEIPKVENSKENEIILFSIREKKVSMWEIIKRTWGGD